MAEQADARDLKSREETRGGSIPPPRTGGRRRIPTLQNIDLRHGAAAVKEIQRRQRMKRNRLINRTADRILLALAVRDTMEPKEVVRLVLREVLNEC